MVGQAAVIDQVLIALVASGHVLIEGVPGLGKTLLVRALAQALSLAHARVQFTPDMMPSDITGHAVLDPATRELRIVRGPVFTHVLLADEINRAPAKTQSALLEVMQEYQVTLEGQTLPLPKPFMVLATQNPVETEGTYPLPEAQLDRFLFKVEIGYPSAAEEVAVVVRATADQAGDELPLADVKPCLDADAVLAACSSWRRGSGWTSRSSTTPSASSAPRATTPASRSAAARAARWRWCAAPAPSRCSTAALRHAGRRQAHRAAGAAPSRRAGAGRAARRTHGQRPAERSHRDRRRAAHLTTCDDACVVIPGRTTFVALAALTAALLVALLAGVGRRRRVDRRRGARRAGCSRARCATTCASRTRLARAVAAHDAAAAAGVCDRRASGRCTLSIETRRARRRGAARSTITPTRRLRHRRTADRR